MKFANVAPPSFQLGKFFHSHSRLASEMQMCKALQFLKYKKYSKAIEALKAFEKKDKVLKAKAATNLSYLYFLEVAPSLSPPPQRFV